MRNIGYHRSRANIDALLEMGIIKIIYYLEMNVQQRLMIMSLQDDLIGPTLAFEEGSSWK